jgi:hypothetical protein
LFSFFYNKNQLLQEISVSGKKLKILTWKANNLKGLIAKIGDGYESNGKVKNWLGLGCFKVVSGIKTGANKKYLRIIGDNAQKNFEKISIDLVLSDEEIKQLTPAEKISGIEDSIHYLPFEMGQPSDTADGLLPCYYQTPTEIVIDWGQQAVSEMKKEKHSDLANAEFRFVDPIRQISFSFTGEYSPTFRLSNAPIFLNASSRIILPPGVSVYYILGLLNSKLLRYLMKTYINHSVNFGVEDVKKAPIIGDKDLLYKDIERLTKVIVSRQKKNPRYDYMSNEQKEIDRLVYEMYGLNETDILEVETWYARRYPKLARFADIRIPEVEIASTADDSNVPDPAIAMIAGGENKYTEFKSTLRYCMKEKKPMDYVQHSALKTIAAFLNSEGGTLIIGVDDDKNILGLDNDFSTFKDSDKLDAFQKHFDNIIGSTFGNGIMRLLNVRFPMIEDKMLCIVEVREKAPSAVWMKYKNVDTLFIRRTASSIDLSVKEAVEYVKEHWK